MTASVIDLRERLGTSGIDLPSLAEIAQQLLGEPFLFARRTYGDELTVHFGLPRQYTLPTFGNRIRGSYVLSTRGSAWLAKSAAWPILVADWPVESSESFGRPISDADLGPGSIATKDSLVVFAAPFVFEPLGSYALRVLLSDGTHLTILPTPNEPDEEDLPAVSDWEILTPHGVLKVGPGMNWKYEPSK